MIHRTNPNFHLRPTLASRRVRMGGEPPAVSIVTPHYNAESYILETYESLTRQTLQAFEWIIVDDGGELESGVASYLSSDPRIRIIQLSQKKGPSSARNEGVRQAKAAFVFFLDSDDLLAPTALEKSLWHLLAYPGLGFTTGFQVGFGANCYLNTNGFHCGAKFLEENCTDIMAMVRRSVLSLVPGFDESIRDGFEDWEFWLHCAALGIWGDTIEEFFDWYRWKGIPSERWANWDTGVRQSNFRAALRDRYPNLTAETFPEPVMIPAQTIDDAPQNILRPTGGKLVVSSTPFAAELLSIVSAQDTVVLERCPEPDLESALLTACPDTFFLQNILPLEHWSQFVDYLQASRGHEKFEQLHELSSE